MNPSVLGTVGYSRTHKERKIVGISTVIRSFPLQSLRFRIYPFSEKMTIICPRYVDNFSIIRVVRIPPFFTIIPQHHFQEKSKRSFFFIVSPLALFVAEILNENRKSRLSFKICPHFLNKKAKRRWVAASSMFWIGAK